MRNRFFYHALNVTNDARFVPKETGNLHVGKLVMSDGKDDAVVLTVSRLANHVEAVMAFDLLGIIDIRLGIEQEAEHPSRKLIYNGILKYLS